MKTPLLFLALFLLPAFGFSQAFSVVDSAFHHPEGKQRKKVLILHNDQKKKLILYRTDLAINTDGTPFSYHPFDLRASDKALNYIANGIAVYRKSDSMCISIPRKGLDEYPNSIRPRRVVNLNDITDAEKSKRIKEFYSVIEQWRDAGYDENKVSGYWLFWKNVLVNKNGKPCIFTKTIEYKGYFASKTGEQNDLKNDTSECGCDNQLDPFAIPALVTNEFLIGLGAKLGSLAAVYNIQNKKLVYAVVGDSGPPENLGEGSIALNAALKDTVIAKGVVKKKIIMNLATGNTMLVCIIPGSRSFHPQKPYTGASIEERVKRWFKEQGIDGDAAIRAYFEENRRRFP